MGRLLISLLSGAALGAALLLSTGAARADDLVLVSGKSKTIVVPFRPGQGINSNPSALQAVVDQKSRQITFIAKREGLATYTVSDAKDVNHKLEYDLRMVGEDFGPLVREIELQAARPDAGIPLNGIDKSAPMLLVTEHATARSLAIARAAAKQLASIDGISIHVTGETVKIEGDVTDAAELDRIDEMTRRINQLL